MTAHIGHFGQISTGYHRGWHGPPTIWQMRKISSVYKIIHSGEMANGKVLASY